MKYDIAIVGAGPIGLAAAKELSRFQGNICVIEREEDICCSSSELPGFIYAGYEIPANTAAADFCIKGNEMMEDTAKELDIPFSRSGSYVIRKKKQDTARFDRLILQGQKNNVPEISVFGTKELSSAGVSLPEDVLEDAEEILYAPSAGTLPPYALSFAFAEIAAANGVDFFFDTDVTGIAHGKGYYIIKTSNETIRAKAVINAADSCGETFNNAVSRNELHMTPRTAQTLPSSLSGDDAAGVFFLPVEKKKSILPLLSASHTEEAEEEGTKDLVLGEAVGAQYFYNAYGAGKFAETCAPAAGKTLAEEIAEGLQLTEKPDFAPDRSRIFSPEMLPSEERESFLQDHPQYKNLCSGDAPVSEGQVIDAITRCVGAVSADGVMKRLPECLTYPDREALAAEIEEILDRELSR